MQLSRDDLREAYRRMTLIREFEDTLHEEFSAGSIPGFVHLYAGEEAAGTGIMMHLTDSDRIASTHRGHGHCIAKGVDVRSMMAEIFGKAAGSCRGKGGSMHIADLSKGMMGANGILGAGAPLACGAALAAKAFETGLPGAWGDVVVTTGILAFAFSTLLGWSFYGETATAYLFGTKSILPYRLLWLVAAYLGATGSLHVIWDVADTLNDVDERRYVRAILKTTVDMRNM